MYLLPAFANEYEPISQKCPPKVFSCMVSGIIEGNKVYDEHAGESSKRVYNLPEAITACKETFQEVDFTLISDDIEKSLPKMLMAAVKCTLFEDQRRLFIVVIGCVRTVLLVYQRKTKTLTLFDTHMHTVAKEDEFVQEGAVIATATESDIYSFASWIRRFIFPDVAAQEKKEFEISLVRYVSPHTVSGCSIDPFELLEEKLAIFPKGDENEDSPPPAKKPDLNNNE